MKILVIIPAYNEEGNIENVIKDLRENCPEADYLVVNDCSTDSTETVLEGMGANHVRLPINLGIGGAVQTGFRYAFENGYDYAVQFDGDGQHDATYISAILRPLVDGEADMSVGSRFVESEGFQSTAMRRFGINFLSRLIKTLCGVEVKDVTSGMRAFNSKLIALFAREYAQDYPEPEAVLSAGIHGARIVEIPVRMRERQSGKSSISPMKSAYYMIKVTLALLFSEWAGGKDRQL